MKYLAILLILCSCTTTSYKNPLTGEEFTLTTVLKKVETVRVVRGNADHFFIMEIANTDNDADIFREIASIIKIYSGVIL